jgi:uncharacterized protein (TIGR00255 family)
MTGFAQTEGQLDPCQWTWELKSVNGKGLDVRCRLPQGFEVLEPAVRKRAQEKFSRGNVTMGLSFNRDRAGGGYRINEAVLTDILKALPDLKDRVGDAGPTSLDGLLGLRGVIEPVEEELAAEEKKQLEAAILSSLDQALDALATMREQEGARLATVLGQQLNVIEGLSQQAETLAAMQPDAIRERLQAQVAELLAQVPALPEERLAQEAAVLMTKADVREELDRLKAHHQAASNLIDEGGSIGRKLDFLCQEFNREANTLCAKSADVKLTNVGIELKAIVEQFREQVQNIE